MNREQRVARLVAKRDTIAVVEQLLEGARADLVGEIAAAKEDELPQAVIAAAAGLSEGRISQILKAVKEEASA